MKIAAAIAACCLVPAVCMPQAPTAMDGARWVRTITPPRANPTAEQCIVVDADLYAHAAPGLRDVRLVQDGAELPYAMDVSFDTRSGEAAPPPKDDRAVYDTVQVIPLHPRLQDGRTTYGNEMLVSAHVPIERLRLDPAPQTSARVDLRAAARMDLRDAEEFHATLTHDSPASHFTIGANLQEEADVLVNVHAEGTTAPKALILEMRRREICYRPRSASPVLLFLGDGGAQPPFYDYALHFQPASEPLLATIGPLASNPGYRAAPSQRAGLSVPAAGRMAVMLAIVLGSVAVIAFAIVELRRR